MTIKRLVLSLFALLTVLTVCFFIAVCGITGYILFDYASYIRHREAEMPRIHIALDQQCGSGTKAYEGGFRVDKTGVNWSGPNIHNHIVTCRLDDTAQDWICTC
jgi:hypothetical protein